MPFLILLSTILSTQNFGQVSIRAGTISHFVHLNSNTTLVGIVVSASKCAMDVSWFKIVISIRILVNSFFTLEDNKSYETCVFLVVQDK